MCRLYSDQSNVFDIRLLLAIIVSVVFVTSHILFLIHEADTIIEIVRSMYMTTSAVGTFISFIATLFKIVKISTLIRNIEKIVEKSTFFAKSKYFE